MEYTEAEEKTSRAAPDHGDNHRSVHSGITIIEYGEKSPASEPINRVSSTAASGAAR